MNFDLREYADLVDRLRSLAPALNGKDSTRLLSDLGICQEGKDREPGPVGQFLLERVEVDIYPAERDGCPLSKKASLLHLLRELWSLNKRRGNALYLHLLAWRFISVGIPSNPVQVHLTSSFHGYMTVEVPLWSGAPYDRILIPKSDLHAPILHALRLLGAVASYELPRYHPKMVNLPSRGMGPQDWPDSWEEVEEQAVWSFEV